MTDETKSTLFIVTTSFQEFTNENGDPDSQDHTTIRQLPVSVTNYRTGPVTPVPP